MSYLRSDPGKANLVTLDVAMMGMEGDKLVRSIKREFPAVNILIISACDEGSQIDMFLRAGVGGYIHKSAGLDVIFKAMRKVSEGRFYLDEYSMASHAEYLRSSVDISLTDREKEVLRLFAAGLSLKQVAVRLGIAYSTVSSHKTRAMGKLGVDSDIELAKRVIKLQECGKLD